MPLTAEPVSEMFLRDSKNLSLTSCSCVEMGAIPGASAACYTALFPGQLGKMKLQLSGCDLQEENELCLALRKSKVQGPVAPQWRWLSAAP